MEVVMIHISKWELHKNQTQNKNPLSERATRSQMTRRRNRTHLFNREVAIKTLIPVPPEEPPLRDTSFFSGDALCLCHFFSTGSCIEIVLVGKGNGVDGGAVAETLEKVAENKA
ncbi:hypothetical protein PIB30_031236 [Stylosanthes scabra]|uniref:Uncharacterized protein n=1 Tax=Stylosanthes scabra TaxID=79078 RepID=A0ABU6UEH8_9FABA|nr:hypothetical protein [Stylosanthes scabra]